MAQNILNPFDWNGFSVCNHRSSSCILRWWSKYSLDFKNVLVGHLCNVQICLLWAVAVRTLYVTYAIYAAVCKSAVVLCLRLRVERYFSAVDLHLMFLVSIEVWPHSYTHGWIDRIILGVFQTLHQIIIETGALLPQKVKRNVHSNFLH